MFCINDWCKFKRDKNSKWEKGKIIGIEYNDKSITYIVENKYEKVFYTDFYKLRSY